MGPAPGPHVRQVVPAHLRGGARPGRPPAARGVQAAPRAPLGHRAAADRAAGEPRDRWRPWRPWGAPRPRRDPSRLCDLVLGARGACGDLRARQEQLARQRHVEVQRAAGLGEEGCFVGDDHHERGEEERDAAGGPAADPRHRACVRVPQGGREQDAGQRRDPRSRRADQDVPVVALRSHARQRQRADEAQRTGAARARRAVRDRLPGHGEGPSHAVAGSAARVRMSSRAGIVVTGTEVLTGRVVDRNGPWLADRLLELGVDVAHNVIVGDRPADVEAALGWLASHGVDLIVTSGGLGPTEDDLTAEVVGRFQGREMVLDDAVEEKIATILAPLAARWPDLDMDAVREANRKQAIVPRGATVLDPVGTAPGLVVPPASGSGPTIVVLPGPPRELQPMWEAAVATEAFGAVAARATTYRQHMLRLFGIPASEIALTLRLAEEERGVPLEGLEITTCMRRGEIEIVTRYEPDMQERYDRFADVVRERHADTLFSDDEGSVDEQVARLLTSSGRTIATAESCTGGLLAGRLTELPGSSAYVLGGLVVYSDEAKTALAGVDPALVAAHGAVSTQVAEALADGAVSRVGADVGVGITGIAGPGGGTPDKPVGLVCFSVASADGARLTRSVQLPGARFDVRDRSTTVAMHMVRRLLLGERDG